MTRRQRSGRVPEIIKIIGCRQVQLAGHRDAQDPKKK
jgi:hypothetical protein